MAVPGSKIEEQQPKPIARPVAALCEDEKVSPTGNNRCFRPLVGKWVGVPTRPGDPDAFARVCIECAGLAPIAPPPEPPPSTRWKYGVGAGLAIFLEYLPTIIRELLK